MPGLQRKEALQLYMSNSRSIQSKGIKQRMGLESHAWDPTRSAA